MAISIKNLNFFYGENQTLFNIDLTVKNGEVVVLLGPSGAGKSTLIRTLNLLERPRSGLLDITDKTFDLSQNADTKAVADLRRKVGMVFQQYHLWPHLTVIENLIEAPIKVLGVKRTQAIAEAQELLERLHLGEFVSRYPLLLSGGQQQRVAIARALMMKPEVLLFDEPTAALDPEITAQVADIIIELKETGITQVIVTHEVSFARKVATQVVYMEKGHIIEIGDAHHFEQPQTTAFSQYLSH